MASVDPRDAALAPGAGRCDPPTGMAINAHRPEPVSCCTRRGQVFGTHDGGASWHEHRLPEGAGHVISVACTSR